MITDQELADLCRCYEAACHDRATFPDKDVTAYRYLCERLFVAFPDLLATISDLGKEIRQKDTLIATLQNNLACATCLSSPMCCDPCPNAKECCYGTGKGYTEGKNMWVSRAEFIDDMEEEDDHEV